MHPLVERLIEEKRKSKRMWRDLPVGRSTMSNWFLDKGSPTLHKIEAMGKEFGLELTWVRKKNGATE